LEKLADVLKLFLEKYFVTTLISITTSILIVATKPNILLISEKTNEILYFILMFCLVFLIVLLIRKAHKTIYSIIEHLKAKEQHQEYVETENRKALETLWTFVDKLSIPDKKALFNFLCTNNTPIESSATYLGDSIFNNSNIMYETIVESVQEEPYHSITNPKKPGSNYIPIGRPIISISVKRYRLNDEFFSLLKYSYEKYKRISHFEEDNQYDKP
jgi:hypothetical protein